MVHRTIDPTLLSVVLYAAAFTVLPITLLSLLAALRQQPLKALELQDLPWCDDLGCPIDDDHPPRLAETGAAAASVQSPAEQSVAASSQACMTAADYLVQQERRGARDT